MSGCSFLGVIVELGYARLLLLFHIFSLLMAALFLVKRQSMKFFLLRTFWKNTLLLQAKGLTTISRSCFLADEVALDLGERCGIPVVKKLGIYLGVPASIGRSKKEVFTAIEDRVAKKLKNWKAKSLSQAGKLTLIKSIAQAISNYVMSCFLLPVSTTHCLNQLAANFWWGQRADERKIH